jgi:hypothetical protein
LEQKFASFLTEQVDEALGGEGGGGGGEKKKKGKCAICNSETHFSWECKK